MFPTVQCLPIKNKIYKIKHVLLAEAQIGDGVLTHLCLVVRKLTILPPSGSMWTPKTKVTQQIVKAREYSDKNLFSPGYNVTGSAQTPEGSLRVKINAFSLYEMELFASK